MGTSSSYKGSTSKVARDLRDGVDQWTQDQSAGPKTSLPERVVAQALKIPTFSRGSGSGGAGGGGGGGASTGGGPKKQSAPRRDARAYASTASRAANLARAFREGDREALEKAGLDFDQLSSLPSRAEMVRTILDVVCEAQTGSDIPAEEQREMAAHLLDWMLDQELNPTPPSAADTAEHAIGLIIAEIFLSEAGEFRTTDGVTRAEFIDSVYETSKQLAVRANLTETGATSDAVDKTIEKGLRFLRRTYSKGDS